jgi:hypothetical protein
VKTISVLVMGLFVEAIILCLIASYRFVNLQSTATLLIFNTLFVSLTFQLNGKLNLKLGLLALGNLMGLFLNFIFSSFVVAGATSFGETFNNFYTFSYPLLNSLWIVTFWSLSLTVLHPSEKCTRRFAL